MTSKVQMVRAFAPATIANVGCGFDVLGCAVNNPGDIVEVHRRKDSKIIVQQITGDHGRLPRDGNNTIVVAINAFFELIKEPFGVDLYLEKGLPLASGLGSSAASAVAALTAVNQLAGNPLTNDQLLPCALAAEKIVSGASHPDNAAASLFGGFILIRSVQPLDLVSLPVPKQLSIALLSPEAEIPTQDARKILHSQIPLSDAISQWGNLAALVASLHSNDFDLMGRSLSDVIAEPSRSVLIPGYNEVRLAALNNKAIGCSISGAGPAVFALTRSLPEAELAGLAMKKAFLQAGLNAILYVSEINSIGSYVMEEH